MELDFNVLKGDIDTAQAETMLSREYSKIWSRTDIIAIRISGPTILFIRGMRCKETTPGQAGDAIVDYLSLSFSLSVATLPIATRGRSSYPVSRYPSPRLATLPLTHGSCSVRRPFAPWLFNILRIGLITVLLYQSLSLSILPLSFSLPLPLLSSFLPLSLFSSLSLLLSLIIFFS